MSIDIDPEIGNAGDAGLPETRTEVLHRRDASRWAFCPLHGGRQGITNVAGWDTAPAEKAPANPAAAPASTAPRIVGSGGDGQVAPGAVAQRAARQEPPPEASAVTPPDAPEPARKTRRKDSGTG